MVQLLVRARLDMLDRHHRVAPNASSALIVNYNWLVLIADVGTLVKERVVEAHVVKL